jgi:cob(I)alamin adenosyltransferase
MKLYTKTGDQGKTSIIGKDRIDKDDIRIEAYGTIDELNSIVGLTIPKVPPKIKDDLYQIQSLLFELGSELASVKPRNSISEEDISHLESLIDLAVSQTPDLKSFILPGGSEGSSWFHLARTVARRAERIILTFSKSNDINPNIIPWMNRLSDLLFAWARLCNVLDGIEDVEWKTR